MSKLPARNRYNTPGSLHQVRPKQRVERLPVLPATERQACERLLNRVSDDYLASPLASQEEAAL
ncbi:hypothetical protein, partial [Hymenobacter lapidiphilus]